jgi:hypothetical protein
MFQTILRYSLLFFAVIAFSVMGFYFGRKSELDKNISFNHSLSHAESMVDTLGLIHEDNEAAHEHLVGHLDNNLFTVFYVVASAENELTQADMFRINKLVKEIDEALSRDDNDYLPNIKTNQQSQKEYHAYIIAALKKIRAFDDN